MLQGQVVSKISVDIYISHPWPLFIYRDSVKTGTNDFSLSAILNDLALRGPARCVLHSVIKQQTNPAWLRYTADIGV